MTEPTNPITMSLTVYDDDLEALDIYTKWGDDPVLKGLAEHILNIAEAIKQIRKI